MSVTKSERLMNLVICLLASRQYVTKGRLRATLEPYRECASEEAFERMFERDKDELREMGIPLETGSLDGLFDDEIGYRIPPGEYALPDIRFERDEGAVLGLAARFWQQATLAEAASSALLKLKAAGVAIADSPEPGIEPRVRVEAPAFEPLLQAVCDRRPVRFAYRRSDDGQVRHREVEPWAIDSWHGHWYLAGYDRTREADRVFRLDRIVGAVTLTGEVGEFAVPPDVDVRAKVETFARGTADPQPAILRLRQGTGFPLRRRADRITPGGDGWDVVEVALYPGNDGWLAEFGADVVAVEPAELRDAVIARLRAVVKNAAEAADRLDWPLPDGPGGLGGTSTVGARDTGRGMPAAARAGGAGTQVRRLLSLVPYLLAHPGAYLAEVAGEFGVTEAQLRKDLELLWFCGLPDGLPDDLMEPHVTDGGAIFLRNAEAIIRPLRLSTREAIALLVAVRAIANLPGVGNRGALERAAAKLEAACGEAAAAARRVSVSFETQDIVLGTVRWALSEERALHLRYYVPTRDDVTERIVDPIRVVFEDGRAYLDAWCRASVGVRRFRLDRVVALEVLDEPARVPDGVGAHPRGQDGPFSPGQADTLVTLDVDPACRWVAENYPCERVDELPDGWLRLTMRMTNSGWLRRLVTRLGPAGIIVDPPALATEVGEAARAALARYEAGA